MTTLGRRKKACVRGHINPPRYKSGACVPCQRESTRERYDRDKPAWIAKVTRRNKANPDARRDEQRAWRFGVSAAEVRAIIVRANSCCEACGAVLTNAKVCLDHDHSTGRIRGVLCRFCNALEGMLHKQPERIEMVKAYIQRDIERREISRREAA